MSVSQILTKAGAIRGYKTKLAAYFNIDAKLLTRKAIDIAYKKYEPVIKYKMEHGWAKDHVRADIEAFDFIEELMRHPLNVPHMNGWKDEKDPNNIMLRKLVLIHAVIRDEDSYYDMLELVMDKWKHEHWERYEKSAEHAYKLISFPAVYANLIEHLKEMKKPLEDITNEPDQENMDYVELERRAKNGMEHEG